MKTLYLVRHAKSSWGDADLKDFDRPLNERGEYDAPRMAERLMQTAQPPQCIVSSPALRTTRTADIFVSCFGLEPGALHFEPQLYLAGAGRLLKIIRQFDDTFDRVMLVSHNPALTDLLNDLCDDARLDNMPTCGIAQLTFDVTHWSDVAPGQARLVSIDYPKKAP